MPQTAVRRRKPLHQFKETARVDPYRSSSKEAGHTLCPKCGATSIRGRWLTPEQTAFRGKPDRRMKCPACRQLEERFAQGVVELHGSRWLKYREEVARTIRRTEKIARYRNDQERVLWTSERAPGPAAKVYVTLPELARRIGRQLEKSFHGIAEYVRSTEEPYLRVRWWSDLDPTAARVPRSGGSPRRSAAFRGRGR